MTDKNSNQTPKPAAKPIPPGNTREKSENTNPTSKNQKK